jgi:beta-galactosidase GanA
VLGCSDAVKNSIKGIHKALWHADYPIAILRLDTDVVDDDFSAYKIIYLPFSPAISAASAAKLKKFVQNGGTLIALGSSAQFDDTMGVTSEVPGMGLSELFGCSRKDIRTMPKQLIPDLKLGELSMKTRMHKEILTPLKGAKVIGRFSTVEVAAVENKYGKGKAKPVSVKTTIAVASACANSGWPGRRWIR